MHLHGTGTAEDLARRVRPALALIGKPPAPGTQPATPSAAAGVTGSIVATILGHQGEQNGPVYKVTIGRPDIDMRAHGARITSRMGLNTWAAFAGTDADAIVAGDVAMLERELTPVLKALRKNGIDVVAIHHHMTGVQPTVVFLHYFGKGEAAALARGVRAAIDEVGKASAAGFVNPTAVDATRTGYVRSPAHAAANFSIARRRAWWYFRLSEVSIPRQPQRGAQSWSEPSLGA